LACWRVGLPKAFARPVFCLKLAFFSCILLLVGALVAIGDCIRAGRPRPASDPSVLSAPAPCAIANPQLAASNAAASVNLVAFNIAYLLNAAARMATSDNSSWFLGATMTVSRNWRLTFGWEGEDAVDVDLEDYHG
jgi:hypothetical protein